MTDFCAAVLIANSGDKLNPTDFCCAQASFLPIYEWGANTLRSCGIDTVEIFKNATADNIAEFASNNGKEFIFILCASVPFINSDDLNNALNLCKDSGYPVLIINEDGQRAAGLALKRDMLAKYSGRLQNLFDVFKQCGDGGKVTVRCKEVYDGASLFAFNDFTRKEIISEHLKNGVNIPCADGIIIDPRVKIGVGTIVLPGTIIKGNTVIGESCTIGPNSYVQDSAFGDNVTFKSSFSDSSKVGNSSTVGPFSNLRPNSHLAENVKIGDFVEIKNSSIGEKTSVAHLTYVGDSDVGCNVNFGCGTVTSNYDGKKKYRTIIGNNVFIGCNTNLVAPVTVSDNSYIAAGSTITDNIPKDALAIARAHQVIKENWVKLREEKNK